jgi:hypothetical protein
MRKKKNHDITPFLEAKFPYFTSRGVVLGLPVPVFPMCIVSSPFIIIPIIGVLAINGAIIVAMGVVKARGASERITGERGRVIVPLSRHKLGRLQGSS